MSLCTSKYNLIYTHKKTTASIFRQSQNQQMPIRISCRFFTPNFTQNRTILVEMWAEVCVRPSVKYRLCFISFHTFHRHLIIFFGHFSTEYFPNCIETLSEKIPLPFKIKQGFHCTDLNHTNFFSWNMQRLRVKNFTHTGQETRNGFISSFGPCSRP